MDNKKKPQATTFVNPNAKSFENSKSSSELYTKPTQEIKTTESRKMPEIVGLPQEKDKKPTKPNTLTNPNPKSFENSKSSPETTKPKVQESRKMPEIVGLPQEKDKKPGIIQRAKKKFSDLKSSLSSTTRKNQEKDTLKKSTSNKEPGTKLSIVKPALLDNSKGKQK